METETGISAQKWDKIRTKNPFLQTCISDVSETAAVCRVDCVMCKYFCLSVISQQSFLSSALITGVDVSNLVLMVWYGMVHVNLYSAIVANVSNALGTLVPGKQPSFQALFERSKVLLCAEVVRQRVPNRRATCDE